MKTKSSRTTWKVLLAVFGAIGAAALYFLRFQDGLSYSPEFTVYADILVIRTQLKVYKERNGFYPTTEQGLAALCARPQSSPIPEDWVQLFDNLVHDPWRNAYVYRLLGSPESGPIDLYSRGPDRVDSADDIRAAP